MKISGQDATPVISIIVTIHNIEKYLRECLDSILEQTFPDIEVLCIVDGSTDSSAEILREYAQKDSRFKIFTQRNFEFSTARNVGLLYATGEYIMFCDSDDMYEPEMCEQMAHALRESKADFVMCDANILVQEGDQGWSQEYINYYRLHFKGRVYLAAALKREINVCVWNKIFKKDIIRKYHIAFPEGYNECEDSAFVMQYLSVSEIAFGLNQKLYDYRLLDDSVMDRIDTQKRYERSFDKAYALSFVARFLNENNLMEKNIWFIDSINNQIQSVLPYFRKSQKKNFLKAVTENVLSQINRELLKTDTERYQLLLLCLDGHYDQLIRKKRSRVWWGKVKNTQKTAYYCLGIPIYKKRKSKEWSKYYFFGIQFGRRKRNRQRVSGLPSESDFIAIAEPENIPEEERYITCFDCLFDPHQEAVDAFSLYRYLKEKHIPCKYVLPKGHRLEKLLSDPDVIVVSDKTDFITNHGDIIRRSKALVTSFGFGMNLDKTFSDINYLDYVFIEHGVIFLKKGRVLNRYNTLVFNRMIVPTRLTYDIYKDDNRYQKECLILSGIPRWDYLKNNRNGHIFVFFTWRTTFQKDPKSAHFYIKYIESFVNKLAQSLDNRVEIDVAAHHELGKIGVESYHFENEHVHLVDTDNISSMIRESSMLITDYSSVAFDFMYQDKPVIFYKFDRDALYLNHTDLIACLEAMQEDEKLYNCLYSEQEIFDKVQDYVARNFELEDELKKKNSQIFWERNNDCCAKLAEALIKKRRVMKGDLTQLGE